MAEPEQFIVICEKCGARLKLKPIQAKMLSEVKCGKCGNRIPTSTAVPASSVPPSVAAPISELTGKTSPQQAAPPPAPEPEPESSASQEPQPSSEPPPITVPTMESYSKTSNVEPARAPTPPPPSRTSTIKSRTSSLGAAPGLPTSSSADGESGQNLRRKNQDLEQEVNVFRQQVLTLESQIKQQQEESGRFQELLQRAADAEERATELQELWYQKEKDYHALEARAEQIAHERDEAYAIRDSVLNDIKDLLATYHATEVEAGRKRLADLDDRIDRFVTLIRQRNLPPPPPPPSPIKEAS